MTNESQNLKHYLMAEFSIVAILFAIVIGGVYDAGWKLWTVLGIYMVLEFFSLLRHVKKVNSNWLKE